jgi:2-dehydropantoate 2-reductase
VQAIRRDGLHVKFQEKDSRIQIEAVSDPADIHPGEGDRLLLSVKTQHTETAAGQLAEVFPRNTPVISLQNAVRNEEILARYFQEVYGGLVDFSGTFVQPGRVVHTRNNLVAIGRFPGGLDPLAESVAEDLERAGFQVERSSAVMAIKWWKLILNTTNALLAILDCWLQKAMSDSEICSLMAAVFEESLAVVRQIGIQVEAPQGTPSLEATIQKMKSGAVASAFILPEDQRTYPSTWQDLRLQRGETEVHYLNGEIERLGIQLGLATPLNSFLLRTVTEMSQHKEMPGKFSAKQLGLIFEDAKQAN